MFPSKLKINQHDRHRGGGEQNHRERWVGACRSFRASLSDPHLLQLCVSPGTLAESRHVSSGSRFTPSRHTLQTRDSQQLRGSTVPPGTRRVFVCVLGNEAVFGQVTGWDAMARADTIYSHYDTSHGEICVWWKTMHVGGAVLWCCRDQSMKEVLKTGTDWAACLPRVICRNRCAEVNCHSFAPLSV